MQKPVSLPLFVAVTLLIGMHHVHAESFPAFDHAVFPVTRVPNWGAMRTPQEWNRSYNQLERKDFVPVPTYNIATLTIPLLSLLPIERVDIPILTAKLTYSTRHFGAYSLDSNEYVWLHPGIDIKLAEDTPIGAIAGGRVQSAKEDLTGLGHHVIIEHRLPNGETVYSIYGHLNEIVVNVGDNVTPGTIIGTVGMTGNTTAPHLHLQIDRKIHDGIHVPYHPREIPSRHEALEKSIHPIQFITQYQ